MPSTTRAISKGPASTGRNPSIDFTKGESACSAAGAIFWTYSQSAEPGDLDLHISGTHFIDLIFFEGGGEASLEFSMNLNGGAFGHVGDFAGTSTAIETVPEPSTVILLGLGLGALGIRYRRNTKAQNV